jgi:acyl carrier protein
MNELEDTFAVYIEEEAAFSFESVGDVSEYIRQRLAAKAGRADAP